MNTKGLPLKERFWLFVKKGAGCWEWTGSKNSKGRGEIMCNYKHIQAHRLSWELANGPIPNGLWVLHRCDNPACVRPDHLFLGTHQDNMDDMVAKGRSPQRDGELNPFAKLTRELVIRIRLMRQGGKTFRAIAKEVGVSHSAVYAAVKGHSWGHIQGGKT